MLTAKLADNRVVNAKEYENLQEKPPIFCMDCKAPLHYVKEGNKVAYFKTSGKGDSIHNEGCAFAAPLSFTKSVEKVMQFQKEIISKVEPIIIRLNMNKLDPDYVAPERAPKEETNEVSANKLKVPAEKSDTPKSLSSLKGLKKLFLTAEPDLLASVILSFKGQKIPISSLIMDQHSAHQITWEEKNFDVPYFVHGTITSILRLPKVWYFNMAEGDFYFTLVVFSKYFDKVTYTDEQLKNKPVLVMGNLKKNAHHLSKPATEIFIKSDGYIEFLD